MMNLKKATVIFSTTLSSILCFNSIKMAKADTVHNTGTITMTVMHTSKVYNKKGKSTGKKFKEYDSSVFSIEPVTINGAKYYECYEGYIKKANIDGVKRKLTNNSYIYSTSNKRTSYSGKWKLQKGKPIVTYGSSYKFKNGKKYYRIAGPDKQYVKASNVSTKISDNEIKYPTEAVATVKSKTVAYNRNGEIVQKNILPETKFSVDYGDYDLFDKVVEQSSGNEEQPVFYRIKGTDQWLSSENISLSQEIPIHSYDYEHYSLIIFTKNTDVYNSDGTIQNNGAIKIHKQAGRFKVKQLLYLWVTSDNKAELFYRLSGKSYYAFGSSDGRIM